MKKIFKVCFVILFFVGLTAEISANEFPRGPELEITSGKLCDVPVKYRYPENVAYCERDVSYETKELVISEYDQKFGYNISKLPRMDFKIDHLIPLCAGGSNDISNLWPQHKSIYEITDPLEPVLCAKMAKGRLKQKDAVLLIIEAKTYLDRTKKILEYINKM